MKGLRRILGPPLLALVGLTGIAVAVGLHPVPEGHIAHRLDSEGVPTAFEPGLQPGLSFWHRWDQHPAVELRLYGLSGRPALRTPAGEVHAALRITWATPPSTKDDPVRLAVQAPGATDHAQALRAALEARPEVAAVEVQAFYLEPRLAQADLPAELRARLQASQADLDAARAAADTAAAEARTATERADAEADLQAAKLQTDADRALADLRDAAARDVYTTRAAADAAFARLVAEGELAHARAQAEVERLTAEALATEGGRWLLALEAARAFKLPHELRHTPETLQSMASVAAWKRYFTGGLAPGEKPARADRDRPDR